MLWRGDRANARLIHNHGRHQRKGVGRVWHLGVGMLWMQEHRLRGVLAFQKVFGTSNLADLMTKHLGRYVISKYCDMLGIFIPWRTR